MDLTRLIVYTGLTIGGAATFMTPAPESEPVQEIFEPDLVQRIKDEGITKFGHLPPYLANKLGTCYVLEEFSKRGLVENSVCVSGDDEWLVKMLTTNIGLTIIEVNNGENCYIRKTGVMPWIGDASSDVCEEVFSEEKEPETEYLNI